MKTKRSLEDFFASSEESSLVSLVEIVKASKGPLAKIFRFNDIEAEDLTGRLMARVGDFSYQDKKGVLKSFMSKARFCEAVFPENSKHICLLGAILSTPETVAYRVLESIGVDCDKLLLSVAREFEFEKQIFDYPFPRGVAMGKDGQASKKKVSLAADYGIDLTERYKKDKPQPFIGRERHLSALVRMLGRMRKNSALVLGRSGVGKTALIDELAYRMASGSVNGPLADMLIFRLDLEKVDDLPKKFCDMHDFLLKIIGLFDDQSKVVFVMDWQEITLPGQNSDIFTTFDVISCLKQLFRESRVRFILVGHPDSYDDFLMDCPEVSSLVGILRVDEASEVEAMKILLSRKTSYEVHHGVSFSEVAVKKVLANSMNILDGTCLPGRALELLDDVGSNFSAAGAREIGAEEIETFFDKEKSEPVIAVGRESYDKRLPDLSKKMKMMVIGQDAACDLASDAVMAINDPNRPIASLFFAGPSGVGKTLLAESLAKALFDEEDCFLRLDMSEYFDKHEIARLIGAPPGYVGYDDEGKLTAHIKKNPRSVILFDEIEKAHHSIYDVLLQVFDYGFLTNGKGDKLCFRNSILIMTSNIDLHKGGSLGFGPNKTEEGERMAFGQAMQNNSFRREFVGRLDQFVEFAQLSHADFLKIIDLEIAKIAESAKKRGLAALEFDQAAKDFIVKHSATKEYGARNLNGSLRRLVRVPLGKMLVYGGNKEKVCVSLSDSGLVFV